MPTEIKILEIEFILGFNIYGVEYIWRLNHSDDLLYLWLSEDYVGTNTYGDSVHLEIYWSHSCSESPYLHVGIQYGM